MENKNDRLEKTREIPQVEQENSNPEVHKDQQSLFDDAENAFSESMVVEKSDVNIDSSENANSENFDGGSTAVFSFEKKENLDAKELQDTAKDYYNINHSDSIEDKIGELRKLADESFGGEEIPTADKTETVTAESKTSDKKNKKKKKRGRISDDDIEMLMGKMTAESTSETDEKQDWVKENNKTKENAIQNTGVEKEDGSVEYNNPLGIEEEENEEDNLIKVLGGNKNFKKYVDVFGDDEVEEEYTDRDQEESLLRKLKKKAGFAGISVVVTLVLTLVCAYFEIAAVTGLPNPEIFEAGKFGVTYAMSMLQLMFVGVIFNLEGVWRAVKAFRPGKIGAESFCIVSVLVAAIHSVVSCIAVGDSSSLVSYCSLGLLSLLVLSINSFIKAYTALSSFCIAASKLPKYSSTSLGRDCLEAGRFEKYLDDETDILAIEKNDFVKGFFKKQISPPSALKNSVKIIIMCLIVSVAVGIVTGIFKGAYNGFCAFAAMSLVSLPANTLLSTALPFYFASNKAKKTQTAYIGEAACDTYEKTGVVSFDDTEVFPPKTVKVTSIRTYGDNRIDRVILYMANIFSKMGGPLSFVFSNSIQNIEEFSVEAQIVEQFSNGVNVKIDGKEVLVGTGDFMRLYDIEAPFDNIDESFTRSLGSIMYMALDGALAAKFYIKYSINRNFEPLLHAFYDAGICVGIKSNDPCVTDELVCANLKGSNYPVAVIKDTKNKDTGVVGESTEGAVITLSSAHNFLLGFVRLDNLRNVYRSNVYVSIISAVVGLALAALVAIIGTGTVNVGLMLLFQVFWCVPTVLLSVLSNK